MSGIIEGYNYDIFISYRQKDNKYDGWVTEFVNNLEKELEATFKEEVSVYFDINPHDGLLETHDVDASLKDKLKCLVFIPIISRTYCDPKSFAWEHEFKVFVEQASKDQFGLKVKLPNGNVSSRVLPVRIHDIDNEDIKLCDSILGGVLRGVEFIYKESGVDKPLAPNDDEKKNLNNTKYRIQIIKVAHAIKEIIIGMKAEPVPLVKGEIPPEKKTTVEISKNEDIAFRREHAKTGKVKLLSSVTVLALLIIAGMLAFPGIFKRDKLKDIKDSDGRISIAVTNFDNNTNDTTLNWLTKGIPELIRNNLTGSEELSVQNSQTMFEIYESMELSQNAAVVPSMAREAAVKLKTGTYITGSFQKFGNNILTYIKLIDTKNDELLWTGSIEGNLEGYKYLADSIAARLRDFLEIKVLKQKTSQEFDNVITGSPEALRKYIEGMELMTKGNYQSAIQSFQEAYENDTTFTLAAFYTAYGYTYSYDFHQGTVWIQKTYRGKERLSTDYQLWLELWKANNSDEILYFNDLLENSDIKSRFFWFDIAYNYNALGKYDKSIRAFEKIEKLSAEWDEDWKFRDYYLYFGTAYHNAGMHEKEAKIYETGLKLYPNYGSFIFNQATCALIARDSVKATELIHKCIKLAKEEGKTSIEIDMISGKLYFQANRFDKAEHHYRKALQLKPHDHSGMWNLINVLLQNDKNIPEGLALIDTALLVYPDDINFIRLKGIGCFKLGRYEEALRFLTIYKDKHEGWDSEFDQYFKKVREVVYSQNNN